MTLTVKGRIPESRSTLQIDKKDMGELLDYVPSYLGINDNCDGCKDDSRRIQQTSVSSPTIDSIYLIPSNRHILQQTLLHNSPKTAISATPGYVPLNQSSFVFGYFLDEGLLPQGSTDTLDDRLLAELDLAAKTEVAPFLRDYDLKKIRKPDGIYLNNSQITISRCGNSGEIRNNMSCPTPLKLNETYKGSEKTVLSTGFASSKPNGGDIKNNNSTIRKYPYVSFSSRVSGKDTSLLSTVQVQGTVLESIRNQNKENNRCNITSMNKTLKNIRGRNSDSVEVDEVRVSAVGTLSQNIEKYDIPSTTKSNNCASKGTETIKSNRLGVCCNFHVDRSLKKMLAQWFTEKKP